MSIDTLIVFGFLILTLAVGLYHGTGIKSVEEYALGKRDFSSGTITSTLVATWISGSAFSVIISKTYSDGLYYIIPSSGIIISFLVIGYIIAPHVGRFLGNLSLESSLLSLRKSVRIRVLV